MPARSKVINNGTDILRVFMLAWDTYGATIDPVTIEQETSEQINTRFAREILGVLVKKDFLTIEEVDGEDGWVVNADNFGLAWDPANRDEAESVVREWLGLNKEVPAEKVAPAKKATAKKATTPKPAAEAHDCYCGCGEQITSKAYYKPGHDARHAGVIGRKIAANLGTKGFDRRDLLNDLPSPALVAKAEKIAETAIAKIEQKAAKTAKPQEGTVSVGRKTIPAIRYNDGKVVAIDYTKPLSKTAIGSFKPNAS